MGVGAIRISKGSVYFSSFTAVKKMPETPYTKTNIHNTDFFSF